jgi:two-component system, chemotaxis family, CheB/CheR fusion protein
MNPEPIARCFARASPGRCPNREASFHKNVDFLLTLRDIVFYWSITDADVGFIGNSGKKPDDFGTENRMTEKDQDKEKKAHPEGREKHRPRRFPVVGVGASAGGLEALEQFISGLPEQSGIAFVIVTHTHPDHPTRIPEILRRKSSVQFVSIKDNMAVEENMVYIPPSDKDVIIKHGVLRLEERSRTSGLHMPIDNFLRSLAVDRGDAAGCVILSGTGSDGTGGLGLIKENAGVAMAQTPESSRHGGMPSSAIKSGMVDYVLEPSEMAGQLMEYFQHPALLKAETRKNGTPAEHVSRVIAFLADRTGHDFSEYKKSTLIRRIERRMSVNRCNTFEDYLGYIYQNPEEAQALFKDLLIGVTSFFRNPEVFDFVTQDVLPDLFSRGSINENFRVWIPGCATGEEAYSVAIILLEAMKKADIRRSLQIFATDIDAAAINKARQGLYLENIAADVGRERLDAFFTKENHLYRINKEIRELVVFAEQNVLRDPPFMNLEMLVCRNLLIYLEPSAQNKLVLLFHHILKPGRMLLLGTSESPGKFAELFTPVHKRFSIYKKRDMKSAQHPISFPTGSKKGTQPAPHKTQKSRGRDLREHEISQVVEKKLLKHHTPACVIVNAVGEIIYFHGRTGDYLEPAQGKPNLKITEMAREGLRYVLAATLRRAVEKNEKTVASGVRVKTNGSFVHIELSAAPLDDRDMKDYFIIVFNRLPDSLFRLEDKEKEAKEIPENETSRIASLEQELEDLKENYRTIQEELEISNQELKSANEEMYSSNEELQSTNEEIESSREELESVNEELSTVNSELHEKISEVQDAYTRITDVLNSTGIAILFLDNDLRIKRFTDEAMRLINLIDKDIGRPLDHISHNLGIDNLTDNVRSVLRNLSYSEKEVRTTEGHWYRMRIMPHRTVKNLVEGAVVTLINIDPQKAAQETLDNSLISVQRLTEAIVDTVRESLLVLDSDKRVVMANRQFYETFQTSPKTTEGRYLFDLGNGQWNIPELRRLLQEISEHDRSFQDYEITHHFETIGYKRMRLNARRLRGGDLKQDRILLAIEEIAAPGAGSDNQ